jgi:hypothetical protein
MSSSNASLEAFFALMRERQPRRMRAAFDVLTRKPDPERFLERLTAEGLLTSVPGMHTLGGDVVLHEWPGAKYLAAVAAVANASGNSQLSTAILGILRAVTAEATNEAVASNYQIWVDCAHIIGLVPVQLLEPHDIAQIETWLRSRYDSSLVALELSKGLIPALLSRDDARSKIQLVQLLRLFTQFEIVGTSGNIDDKAESIINAYWLNELLSKLAISLGAFCGWPAVSVLLDRLHELIKHDRDSTSWLDRPAIEENEQNFQRHDLRQALIEGSRDALLGFAQSGDLEVTLHLTRLLQSPIALWFRIALHAARVHFTACQDAVKSTIDVSWFLGEGRHEVYLLLKDRFAAFDETLKVRVLGLVQTIDEQRNGANDDDAGRREKYWLTAIKDSQDARVLARLQTLTEHLGPEDPDKRQGLLRYHESRWGDPPSPYSPSALRSLAEEGKLAETLNSFEPSDQWDGPTIRSLVQDLEKAIVDAPVIFAAHVEAFRAVKPAYQYGLFNAYAQVWEKRNSDPLSCLPTTAWDRLFFLAKEIIVANDISTSDETLPPLTPQVSWLPGTLAQWIKSAVRNDDDTLSGAALIEARDLLVNLLERLPSKEEEYVDVEDAVSYAINSSRGKVIEAILAYCLRAKRTGEDVVAVTALLVRLEILLLNANDLEATTLLAAALPQLEFLQRGWAETHAALLFRLNDKTQLRWALQGLAYSSASRPLHALLTKRDVYSAASVIRFNLGEAWNSLIDRKLVAYLHGDSPCEDPFWKTLLAEHDYESLGHAAWFLWTERRSTLPLGARPRIVEWRRFVESALDAIDPATIPLKGALGRLLWAVDIDYPQVAETLLTAARYAKTSHHEYEFAEELLRFVKPHPDAVLSALNELLQHGPPVIDYDDAFYKLVLALHDAGAIAGAVSIADQLRHIESILSPLKPKARDGIGIPNATSSRYRPISYTCIRDYYLRRPNGCDNHRNHLTAPIKG